MSIEKPTKEEINDFKLATLKFVTNLYLNENLRLSPALFLLSKDGYRKKFGLPMEGFESQNGKDAVLEIMLDMIRTSETNIICFASEAWALPREITENLTKEEAMQMRPSQHEERIELLNLWFEFLGENMAAMSFEIKEENNNLSLIPRDDLTIEGEDAKSMSGRFVGLLKKAYNMCDDCKEELKDD